MNTSHIPDNHRATINRLFKGGDVLLPQLTEFDVSLWHAATGISTEAGELLEAILPWHLACSLENWDTPHTHLLAPQDYLGWAKPEDVWKSGYLARPGIDVTNIEEEISDHLFYDGALRVHAMLELLDESSIIVSRSASVWPPHDDQIFANVSILTNSARRGLLRDLIMVHAALAGQILDVVKRVVIYRKDFEARVEADETKGTPEQPSLKDKLRRHLIDDCWVVGKIALLLGKTEEELREGNIVKLEKGTKDKKPRYGETYTDEAAINRADKEGEVKVLGAGLGTETAAGLSGGRAIHGAASKLTRQNDNDEKGAPTE